MGRAYSADSFVADEQPTTAKWNKLWNNDASFNDGTGIGTGVIDYTKVATGFCVQQVNSAISAVATGTTAIPFDDTIPQITEGDQYLTAAITPKSTSNILVIESQLMMGVSVASRIQTMALFQDATANALAAGVAFQPTIPTTPIPIALGHTMAAGTTSSTTFRIRAGMESAGTTTVNGQAGARLYGAISKSSLVVREYKA